jgi:hypothetical protein
MAPQAPPEGWFRRMADGRVEVFLKHGDRKLRAHGNEGDMNELVDWFEDKSGLRVEMPWRKRPPSRPIPGQMGLPLTLELGEAREPVLEES